MAKWSINYSDGAITKDGDCFLNLDLSFLPSDILAVQSADGVNADIEKGDRTTEKRTVTEDDVATSSLSWWGSVSSTWQTAYDAYVLANTDPSDGD